VIRPLMGDDRAGWEELWRGYLDFYRAEIPTAVTDRTFERLCSGTEGMFGFVADSGWGLTGLAHALVHPSTWSASGYCYLEDLFVAPQTRGTTTARDLIEAVVTEATAQGLEKVYWHTNEFNGPARSLYDRVARFTSFVVYERPLPPHTP